MKRSHIYLLIFIIIIFVFIIYVLILKDAVALKTKQDKYYTYNLENAYLINNKINNEELTFLMKNYCFLLNNKNKICLKRSA